MFELVASIEKVGDVLPEFKFLAAFGKTDVLALLLSARQQSRAPQERGAQPQPAHPTSAVPRHLHTCSNLPGPPPEDHTGQGHVPHVDT